jgi:hypothetical protein
VRLDVQRQGPWASTLRDADHDLKPGLLGAPVAIAVHRRASGWRPRSWMSATVSRELGTPQAGRSGSALTGGALEPGRQPVARTGSQP